MPRHIEIPKKKLLGFGCIFLLIGVTLVIVFLLLLQSFFILFFRYPLTFIAIIIVLALLMYWVVSRESPQR
ncbi:MAG: hypothetical protein GWO20_07180 [Candidatus Korarchaeota archaeon]|nr:hypothetical protein [Candidatus Korarchaeota archaeon]NIU83225.1 hypothetical protein [Candidatus Thorarchaeota archaeon]NIW13171.1 hypothetical protein [Candidatus Thorarchaeota archaeon]NIW51312.1 hypothetical protein [Candidatus Korarchaeota archaeon]